MNEWLLILAWLIPLAMLPLLPTRAGRGLTAGAALPAVLAAVLVPEGTRAGLAWVLLGLELSLDATGRLFLLFSGLLWLAAGLYGALAGLPGRRVVRFRLFFLLAMAGNLLLILAADMLTFYLGYALMGLSAYALVIHSRSQQARRAGRLYLVWTLIGELALFCAIVLLASAAGSLHFDALIQHPPAVAIALVLLAFGIKLALPGLHVWLPLTYRAAPAVAAAVLSGPMISAGLLGWLRFLPPGSAELAGWGTLLVVLGTTGVVFGVMAGATQRDPRTVLGYSSIAKMGLIAAAYGMALKAGEAGALIVLPLVVFALHHLLVKGALFLGIAEWRRNGTSVWVLAGIGALALSLAGAPLLGGAAAKASLAQALATAGGEMKLLLLVSATGTTGLMLRLLWLLRSRPAPAQARFTPAAVVWLMLTGLALWLPPGLESFTLSTAGLETLIMGLGLALLAWGLTRRYPRLAGAIPPGDILCLLPARGRVRAWREASRLAFRAPVLSLPKPPEFRMRTPLLAFAGSLWLLLFIILLVALSVPVWTPWE